MAKNLVQDGKVLQFSNGGADIASGGYVLLGDNGLHGIALEAIANGSTGSVQIEGVFDVSVKAHNGAANTAVAIYDRVYYTSGDTFCDVDPAAVPFGYALEAVTSGATDTINVLVVQQIIAA